MTLVATRRWTCSGRQRHHGWLLRAHDPIPLAGRTIRSYTFRFATADDPLAAPRTLRIRFHAPMVRGDEGIPWQRIS